ncbi:MAG: hypothetical protein M0Z55_06550 [Peptococcaceae bacterium]|nr:hypothetical protein [Peptococcaceae bacterium]
MVRARKLLGVVLAMLMLGGCSSPAWVTAGKIMPPVNNDCPLEGKWKVLENLSANAHAGRKNQQWVGDSAQFTRGVAMLGGYVWNNPTYKVKNVNSAAYLMTKYITLSSTLVPNNKKVDVITVSAAANFLGEFMKIDNTQIIAFVQNNALLLQKVSDRVDISIASANSNVFDLNNGSKAGASGVLLGLKVPQNNDYTYQTIWVAADNKKLHPLLTENNIFFPRINGFWVLQVRDVLNQGNRDDELSAHDVSTKVPVTQASSMSINQRQVPAETNRRIIDYIGNDYVTIDNDIGGKKWLQVLPVDKISSEVGIKVSDLLGTRGLSAYNSARDQAVRALKNAGVTSIDEDKSEEDFGLSRKNGHWYLQGRINYQKDGSSRFKDFNIDLIPPANLIFFDTLFLNWQNIKDRVPDAIDAFTSPNRDIALIKTKTKLFVYGISDDQLDNDPLAQIELKAGENIIMAEWATGSYVDNWEKAFLDNGAKLYGK